MSKQFCQLEALYMLQCHAVMCCFSDRFCSSIHSLNKARAIRSDVTWTWSSCRITTNRRFVRIYNIVLYLKCYWHALVFKVISFQLIAANSISSTSSRAWGLPSMLFVPSLLWAAIWNWWLLGLNSWADCVAITRFQSPSQIKSFFGSRGRRSLWKCNPEKLWAKNCSIGGHVTGAWLNGRLNFTSRSG